MNKTDKAYLEFKSSLKKLFNFNDDMKYSTYDLTDDTKITSTSDCLKVGDEVYAIDADGNQTPVNDGSYVLKDGRTIVIEMNVIKEIKGDATTSDTPVENADTETMAVDPADTKTEKPEDQKKEGDSIESLIKRVEELENKMIEMMNGQSKANEEMMSKLNIISDEPAESENFAKKGLDTLKSGSKASIEELRDFRQLLKTNNRF